MPPRSGATAALLVPPPVCATRQLAMRRWPASSTVKHGAPRCGRLPGRPAPPPRRFRRLPTPTAVAGASHRTRQRRQMALRNLALIVAAVLTGIPSWRLVLSSNHGAHRCFARRLSVIADNEREGQYSLLSIFNL